MSRTETIHYTRARAIVFVQSTNRGTMYLGEDRRTVYRISQIRDVTRPGHYSLWDRPAGIVMEEFVLCGADCQGCCGESTGWLFAQ